MSRFDRVALVIARAIATARLRWNVAWAGECDSQLTKEYHRTVNFNYTNCNRPQKFFDRPRAHSSNSPDNEKPRFFSYIEAKSKCTQNTSSGAPLSVLQTRGSSEGWSTPPQDTAVHPLLSLGRQPGKSVLSQHESVTRCDIITCVIIEITSRSCSFTTPFCVMYPPSNPPPLSPAACSASWSISFFLKRPELSTTRAIRVLVPGERSVCGCMPRMYRRRSHQHQRFPLSGAQRLEDGQMYHPDDEPLWR